MITSDIFIRCVITRAPTTKKHKEPNFPGWQRAVPAHQPGATGVWGAGVGTRGGGPLQNPAVTGPSLPPGGEQKTQQLSWCHPEPPAPSLLAQNSLYTTLCATCQRMMQRDPLSLEEALVGWKIPWKKQHLRQL